MSSNLVSCAIWGTPTSSVVQESDAVLVDSARAGGRYRITGTAIAMLPTLTNDLKARLTWWLVEQRRQGEECPTVTSSVLTDIRSMPFPTILERRDRILDFIANSSSTITPRIHFAGVVTDAMRTLKGYLAAHSASQNDGEVFELIDFAKEERLLEGSEVLKLTFKAWTYIEERRARQTESIQGFVAMWFSSEMGPAYEEGFAPAIRGVGYRPMRIDRKEHINKIDDEIIAEIRRSRFLVADFTSEPNKPRGGVYFEAGFAMGLNIPVIWTCRSDLVEHLHFDIRQFNQVVWTDPKDLRQKLKNRISAVLGDGPEHETEIR
jgi:hypothetical protein